MSANQHKIVGASITRFPVLLCMFVAMVSSGLSVAVAAEGQQGDATTEAVASGDTLRIPIRSGRVNLGDAIVRLLEKMQVKVEGIRDQLNFEIDLRGTLGKFKLDQLGWITDGVLNAEVVGEELLVRIDDAALRSKEEQLKGNLKSWLQITFDDAEERVTARHGMHLLTPGEPDQLITDQTLPERVVVLIHGLDEPGSIFNALVPQLQDANHSVINCVYPNDQSIADSAVFVFEQLKRLRNCGVQRVDVVAHSMGGLVTRQILTHPEMYAGSGREEVDWPAIDRLIMVGTPNHGSQMARLRILSEWREHIERAINGEGVVIGGLFDGAGQAGRDLIPGSPFLESLNNRPLPTHVQITIIAGKASPMEEGQLESLMGRLKSVLPDDQHATVDRMSNAMNEITDGVGDGCVSLESAKLEGVEDFVIVNDNHVTMLGNLTRSSARIPPSVPVILDRLEMNVE